MQLDLNGRMYEVRTKVMLMHRFSGHADQEGLVRFALCDGLPARKVVLVHGEAKVKEALGRVLVSRCIPLEKIFSVCIP